MAGCGQDEYQRFAKRGYLNLFAAIFLGIVQRFTELFPVSNSAHLVIREARLKFFAYYCWTFGIMTLLVKSSFF